MNEEVTIEHNEKIYVAEYCIDNDLLTVYLPDGSIRQTELRGLIAHTAATVHLKSYIKQNT